LTGVCSFRLAPRAGRLSWRALWGWAAAVQIFAFGALALTSTDVFTYLCYGALSLAGLSPYSSAPAALGHSPLVALVPARWVDAPSAYGPLFHPVVEAAVWVGSRTGAPLWGAFFFYKALMVAAVLTALFLAARHLRATRPEEAPETFTLLAMGPVAAWEIAAQGHNEGLLFLALVAFLAAAAASRGALGIASLAAGIAVKYALAPLLGLYLLATARRSVVRAVMLAVVAAIVMLAAFAPVWREVTLRAVIPSLGSEPTHHAHSLTDLVCLVLDGLGRPAASVTAYRFLSTASAVLCAGTLLWGALRSRTLEELAHGYLLFLMALYLTAPWFQPWYVCWGLPLLLVEPDPQWRRFFALFAAVTVAQWAAPLDPVTTVAGDLWAAHRMWRLTAAPSSCDYPLPLPPL
jgi:hypothetical protein